MTGAESLLRTLVASGVEVCFGNPGTSEMHFVAALDRVQGMRAVLGLFEGAVTGMADGYGRLAEKPAATLLHLGPGRANGLRLGSFLGEPAHRRLRRGARRAGGAGVSGTGRDLDPARRHAMARGRPRGARLAQTHAGDCF